MCSAHGRQAGVDIDAGQTPLAQTSSGDPAPVDRFMRMVLGGLDRFWFRELFFLLFGPDNEANFVSATLWHSLFLLL